MNTEKLKKWYFLIIVFVLYLVLLIINPTKTYQAIINFINILGKIYYVFIIIFVLMTIVNYYIKPNILVKYLGKNSGAKGWFIAILSGIISTGPIYMWYPLLKELKEKGVRTAYIATFLYNRSVKIPLIPLMLVYFSVKYVIILITVTIIISIIQGIIIEKIVGVNKNENSNSIRKK